MPINDYSANEYLDNQKTFILYSTDVLRKAMIEAGHQPALWLIHPETLSVIEALFLDDMTGRLHLNHINGKPMYWFLGIQVIIHLSVTLQNFILLSTDDITLRNAR